MVRFCSCIDALGKKDVRLAATVRVGQHSCNPESKPKIELVRVMAQIPDAPNRARNIRIEIRSAQCRFAVFVVAASPKRQRASKCDESLEIFDKRPPDAPSTM